VSVSDVSARILARMSVSASWNAGFIAHSPDALRAVAKFSESRDGETGTEFHGAIFLEIPLISIKIQ